MTKTELKEIINKIIEKRVNEELNRRIPLLVNSFLSEQYVKRLVSEQVGRQPNKINELIDNDEDEENIPKVMHNRDKGIYDEDPFTKNQQENVGFERLIGGNPSLRSIYEGVRPASSPGSNSNPVEELVPEHILKSKLDMKRIKQIAQQVIPKRNNEEAMNEKMAFLERQRKRLDEMIVGSPTTSQAPRRQVQIEEDPFEAKMRELASKY